MPRRRPSTTNPIMASATRRSDERGRISFFRSCRGHLLRSSTSAAGQAASASCSPRPVTACAGSTSPGRWSRLLHGRPRPWASPQRFSKATRRRPPVEPASADVVLARHVLWALPNPLAVLRRWVDLLAAGGLLVIVEGRWSTGAGLTAAECTELVLAVRADATVVPLTDPALWGGPIDDERYLVTSRR